MAKITYLSVTLFMLVSLAGISTGNASTSNGIIQRVRIDFVMPNGYVRHLLLSFTSDNSASDAYDYGYDALNKDDFPYDLNWIIENERYVIQGVGAFENTKRYPLGMFMAQDGNIQIALDTLENFDTPIDLFIYDSQLNTYTQINYSNYAATISKGDYLDRFYLTFKDGSSSSSFAKTTLTTDEINLEDTKVSYLNNTKELYINTNETYTIKNIYVNNLLGQELLSLANVNAKIIKIPMQTNQTKFGVVTIETAQGKYLSKKIAIN